MLDSDDAMLLLTETLGCLQCEVNLPPSWYGALKESVTAPLVSDDKRRFPRYCLHACAALQYSQTLPTLERERVWHKIFVKNVSRGGLSFYHSESLFPKERMRILLPDGTERTFEVVRCRRIQDHCFEIGGPYVQA